MYVIEFYGMPKAGKSTQIDILETYFKREKQKKVRVVHEGARICPIDKEDRFHYNIWSLNNTINRIIETKKQSFDYVLIDRGVIDHIAFTQALYKSKYITKKQMEITISYAKQFIGLEDIAFCCFMDPEETIDRENKHHRTLGRVINPKFLKILHKCYMELEKYLPKTYMINSSEELTTNRDTIAFTLESLELYQK